MDHVTFRHSGKDYRAILKDGKAEEVQVKAGGSCWRRLQLNGPLARGILWHMNEKVKAEGKPEIY